MFHSDWLPCLIPLSDWLPCLIPLSDWLPCLIPLSDWLPSLIPLSDWFLGGAPSEHSLCGDDVLLGGRGPLPASAHHDSPHVPRVRSAPLPVHTGSASHAGVPVQDDGYLMLYSRCLVCDSILRIKDLP